ncbi:MAG TPA: DMT family transporter, partial [Acidimicrobiales bacterium]|nr:DMT family transporter [Acidimicrobiales bacterium]
MTTTRWLLWFVTLSAIWGFSFLFIKVADESLAPVQVALGRTSFGLAAVVAILVARRQRPPSGARTWGHLAVAALLLNAAPFTLYAYGETRTSSVLAGIFNATTPLFAVPIAALVVPGERLTRSRLGGLAVGFAGAATVLGIWRGLGGAHVEGDLLCLGGAACYGVGFPYARRFLTGRAEPWRLAAGQLACATVELAIVSLLVSSAPAALPARALAAVAALGIFGTGIAYVLSFTLLRDAGPAVSSTVTYAIPAFSTLA